MPLDIGFPLAGPRAGSRTRSRTSRRSRGRARPRARPVDLARGELARGAVGPDGGGEADAPAGPPARASRRVSGSGCTIGSAAPERMPKRSKSAIGVSTGSRAEDEVRHHGPVPQADSNASGRSAFPRIEPLTSGIADEHELLARGTHRAVRAGPEQGVLDRPAPRPGSWPRNRSTISASSPSVVTYAGARSVWSPAKPSA